MTISKSTFEFQAGDLLVGHGDEMIRFIWLADKMGVSVDTDATVPSKIKNIEIDSNHDLINNGEWIIYRNGQRVRFETVLEPGDYIIGPFGHYIIGSDRQWHGTFKDRFVTQATSYRTIEEWGVPCVVWRNGSILTKID